MIIHIIKNVFTLQREIHQINNDVYLLISITE